MVHLARKTLSKCSIELNAGSWKVIIPSSGFSMKGSREKFHHQVFSLIIDREVSEEFPKSSHVGLGTIFISAMKTREKTLITRGMLSHGL
jgi:hypothetical protein